MPALIDTHMHLVYPEVAGYGWTNEIPPLANHPFMLERYQELTEVADMAGALFMETGVDDADYQAEIRFVAGLASKPDSGILGLIASCRPETDAGYSDWLDECDSLNVVGYRRILHVMDDALSTTEIFRRNVRAIGERGKTFDMCFLSRQLSIAAELARACDNTQLILNHCGVPDIAGGGLDPWRADMQALASLPHVVCKLSGLLAYCAAGTASLETIQPYVNHVFDVFGTDRIVWGSDWPVVELANGLPDWLEVTKQILGNLSVDESTAISSESAVRVYKLPV